MSLRRRLDRLESRARRRAPGELTDAELNAAIEAELEPIRKAGFSAQKPFGNTEVLSFPDRLLVRLGPEEAERVTAEFLREWETQQRSR
jgi:hypothetical protein